MHKKIHKKQVGPMTALALLATSAVCAFTIGINTANKADFVNSTFADKDVIAGDFDADGELTNNDATIGVEIAGGLRPATSEELEADPIQDGHITAADILWIMDRIK